MGVDVNRRLMAKDVRFMVLTVLKHGQHLNLTARLFGVKCSTVKRVVTRFIKIISGHLDENCVERMKVMDRVTVQNGIKSFQEFLITQSMVRVLRFGRAIYPLATLRSKTCTFPGSTC